MINASAVTMQLKSEVTNNDNIVIAISADWLPWIF